MERAPLASNAPASYESALARLLLVVYVLLVVYASLYPFSGWRDPGTHALSYLFAPRPRYVTAFDVVANIVGYVPCGFLGVLVLRPRLRGGRAVLAASAGAALLSFALEATQTYLASRFASRLDLLCNAAGAVCGSALGLCLAPWLLERGPLRRLREAHIRAGTVADLGLVLLGLWLFTQLNPATLLFGTGDLRDLVAAPAGPARPPEFFVSIETYTSAANLAAVALVFSAIATPGRPPRLAVGAMVLLALCIKTAAVAIVMRAHNVFLWLTPGARQGLVVGLLVALLALGLPRIARMAVAAVLIMAATVFVNLAPPNPYLAETLKVWQQGHFLNFNGLTRLVTAIWPFTALGYLIFLASRRSES